MISLKKKQVDLNLDQDTARKLWKIQERKKLKQKRKEHEFNFDNEYCWGANNAIGMAINLVIFAYILIKFALTSWVFCSIGILGTIASVLLFLASLFFCEGGHYSKDTWWLRGVGLYFTVYGWVVHRFLLSKSFKQLGLKTVNKSELEEARSINTFVFQELSTRQEGLLDQIRNQIFNLDEARTKLERISYNLRSKKADPDRIELVDKLIEKLDEQQNKLKKQKITCLNALGDIRGYIDNTNNTLEEEISLRTIQDTYKLVEDSELMIYDNETHICKLLEMRNHIVSQFEATRETLKLTERAQLELARI